MTGRRRETEAPAGGPAPALPPVLPGVVVRAGTVATASLADVDALVLPVAPGADGDEGVQPRHGTVEAAVRYGVDLADLADRHDADGSAGSVHTIHLPRPLGGARELPWSGLPARVLLVGVGGGTPADLRKAGAAVARATRGLGEVVTTAAADTDDDGTGAFVEGYLLGAYRHPTGAAKPGPGPAATLTLLGDHGAIEPAQHVARATWLARALTVTPASTKTPAWLADQAVAAVEAAGRPDQLTVTVLGPDEIAARGFGGLAAVGAGSVHGPRFVTVRYVPAGARGRHVVVVGKGITFDSGGLAIKPRESMVGMKTDMAGSAVALATVLGAASLGVPHRVTALLPLAENAFGGASYRPGDVLRVYGGTTVEIANTDAEGRLVLADALAYADADLDPDVLVDVATLTGAATLGLGKQHGALYSADEALAAGLVRAGAASGDALWRMPLVPEYRAALDSAVADVRHVADPGVGGGSITAALFLQRFAGRRRWAHLDIAGPARSASASHEVPEGATGFGVRVLLRWLRDL